MPSWNIWTLSRGVEWVVYSKRPFGGPEAVLAYLSPYTSAPMTAIFERRPCLGGQQWSMKGRHPKTFT